MDDLGRSFYEVKDEYEQEASEASRLTTMLSAVGQTVTEGREDTRP